MKMLKPVQISALATALLTLATIGVAWSRDLWIHPRGEAFNPDLHYRDASGQLYYKAENDISNALGYIEVEAGEVVMRAPVGPELQAFADHHGGSLRPVLLWDSTGDGAVDRSARGRIEDGEAVFRNERIQRKEMRRQISPLRLLSLWVMMKRERILVQRPLRKRLRRLKKSRKVPKKF